MAYIIENAHVLKDGTRKVLSLLVEKDTITSVGPSFRMYKHIRMDAAGYIMTPTHVLLDSFLPLSQPFEVRKAHYLTNFIKKGCTTIITCVAVQREKELEPALKRIRTQLLDCPVDYVIGVRVPASKLTPGLIRRSKKERLPVIFVEVKSISELFSIPWGWIKEAIFPYNSPLVPVFINKEDKSLPKVWAKLMAAEKIPSFRDELEENIPLGMEALKKIGVYPRKSNLHHGGEVSYNFYLQDRETVNMTERELFMSKDSFLEVTLHKGKVIRAGRQISYSPGYGEYLEIITPSFYLTPT
ncbi:hypothetical protein AB1K84_06945 [Mesobacillus foraminis]|uniref:hypothetical protein n=1 Tax=Mesobacillus foraminis TaxID=279826 RepID=UPI0039A3366B